MTLIKELSERVKEFGNKLEEIENEEPFTVGEEGSHGVYGDGKILNLNKIS